MIKLSKPGCFKNTVEDEMALEQLQTFVLKLHENSPKSIQNVSIFPGRIGEQGKRVRRQ